MQPVDAPRLTLMLPPASIAGFASLLQHGILFAVDRPVGMLPFLLSLPGFDAAYIESAVQTIFINGVAADSLDRILSIGSTLALSAAMPGLAGAIFRRQGLHASLRSKPQEKAPAGPDRPGAGFLTLKLFNRIAADRVEDLLTQGILIAGASFRDFAVRRDALFQPPAQLMFSGASVDPADLPGAVAGCPVLAVRAVLLPEH